VSAAKAERSRAERSHLQSQSQLSQLREAGPQRPDADLSDLERQIADRKQEERSLQLRVRATCARWFAVWPRGRRGRRP
jgi:hypothetical protein